MKRSLMLASLALLFGVPALMAQTTSSSTTTSYADRNAAENVNSGYVNERSPGKLVQAARARHIALRDARLSAQHSGDTSLLAPEGMITSSSSSGSSVSNLLTSLLGGSGSSILTSLLGGSSTGSTGSSGSLSNLPPEVIQMLTSFGIDPKDLANVKQKNETTTEDSSYKTTDRSQTSTTTTERPFVVRWADAMLSTIFTTAAVAVQTSDFIGLLKTMFRPLFGLEEPAASTSNMSWPPRSIETGRVYLGDRSRAFGLA